MAARPASRCSVIGSPNPQPEFYLNRSHTPRTRDGMGCFLPSRGDTSRPTSPSSLRDATSPSRGGFGSPLGFSSSPEARLSGELSAKQTERLYGRCPCPGSGCFRFRDPEALPQMKQLLCPTSPSSLRDATSPTRGAVEPKARLRGCMGGSPAREAAAPGFWIQRLCLRRSSFFVQPLRHPFGMPPPLVGEALAVRWAFPLRQRLSY